MKRRQLVSLALLVASAAMPRETGFAGEHGGTAWPVPAYEESGMPEDERLPALSADANLQDYLRYAALNNPGLEAAFNEWKASMEAVTGAKALPDPKFTFAHFVESVETRVGPQKNKLGLMQVFPWFGTRRLQGEVATEAAHAAFEQYQATKLQLFYEVKKAYYEYHYLHRAISITDDNVQLLKHLEGVAQSKHRAGASQIGVIKAQVELGRLDDRLRTLGDLRGPMAARLNAVLNHPRDELLPWPRHAPLEGATFTPEALFRQLATANPELNALDKLVEKEEKAIALARKDFFPNVVLGVDYIDTGEALMPGTPDSGKDPIIAKLAFDIPIWRGKYKAGLEQARRRHVAAAMNQADRGNDLEAELRMALFLFDDAERKIDLYGDTLLPQAEQSLKVTEEAYRSGSDDFLNLIDAERLLLEFQLAHERSLADREIAVAEIEKLVGRPLGAQTARQGSN